MEKINILFCGQIRNPKNFYKLALQLCSLKIVENVYLSTWSNEDNKKLRFFNNLNKKFVYIHETEPDYKNFNNGSAFYQMKSLENGLSSIKNKSIKTFKTRPDLYINPSAIKKIKELDYSIEADSIFSNKIWIPFFEISKPFYFADECFYGSYEDLKKLINYDTYFDTLNLGHGLTHVRKYAYPYLNKNKKLKTYFETFQNSNFGENRFKFINEQIKNKQFLDYLFYNFYILNRDFRVGIGSETKYMYLYKYHDGLINPDNSYFSESFVPENSIKPTLGHIFSFTETWLKKVLISDDFKNNISQNPLIN